MDVRTYPIYDEGESLLVLAGGSIARSPDSVSIDGLFSALRLLAVMEQVEKMAAQVPLEAPRAAAMARAWDE